MGAEREHEGAGMEHMETRRGHKGAKSEPVHEMGFSRGAKRRRLSPQQATRRPQFGEIM